MTNRIYSFLIFAFIITVLIFHSCKEPENIGLEYIKSDVNVAQSDSFSIIAYTIKEDSIATLSSTLILYNSLVGSYHDSEFGQIDAGFCTQFSMTSPNINFGDNPVLDSVILSLPYADSYGYDSVSRTFHVYKVTEDITIETDFNPYKVVNTENIDLANAFTFIPNTDDSVTLDGKKYAPMLRIPLSLDFGNTLLAQAGSSVYESNENFQQFLKGLYVKSAINSGSGGLLSFYTIHDNAALNLYFHNDQAASNVVSFVTKSNAKWRNIIAQDYSTASPALQQQLSGNYVSSDSVLYIMAFNSTKVKLSLPFIRNNASLSNIVINNAELILPIENISNDQLLHFSPPPSLVLTGLGSDSNYYSVPSIVSNNGLWNGEKREFRLNVTILIQFMLTNRWEHPYLILRTVEGIRLNSAKRAILKGYGRADGMRLKITYTKNK